MTAVAPGDVLAGKYRVTKVLGVGGMGVVVAAVHLQLEELVALKFMLPDALVDLVAIQRFLREARAAVKLRSEHVARVSDVGTLETGAPYIVMEYLEGTDLAGLLTTQGVLAPDAAVEYVLQVCDALAEAHAMGVVHRDLKPANLFLTYRRDGTPLVKVLDFGISKSTVLNEQPASTLTKTGGILGSPVYMSPEQMKSAKDTDSRTDIWALGVILYELLGGRPPFEADTIGGLMAIVLTERAPPLARLRPDLPPGLSEVIDRCLEKDRDRRWPDVAQLALALAPFAPARTRPLVERISIVVAQTSSTIHRQSAGVSSESTVRDAPVLSGLALSGPVGAGLAASRPAVAVTGHGPTVAATATSAGWGSTGDRPTSRFGKGALIAAVVAALGVAFVAMLGVHYFGGSTGKAQAPPSLDDFPAAATPATLSQSANASASSAMAAPSTPVAAPPSTGPAPESPSPPSPSPLAKAQPPAKKPPVGAAGHRVAASPGPAASSSKPKSTLLDTSN